MATVGELLDIAEEAAQAVTDAVRRLRAKIELEEGIESLDDEAPPTPPATPAPGPGTGGGGSTGGGGGSGGGGEGGGGGG